MKTHVSTKPPNINFNWPTWWHHHGGKMKVVEVDARTHTLIIEGSAAKLTIRSGSSIEPTGRGWIVEWEVTKHASYNQLVRGWRHFSDAELAAAFGLTSESGDFGDW
ncbi:MAG TPA: hypothetical protein VHD37_02845, partial [Candidatus Paceibacterota bacterium]|nr:hypothetical protein [Candidatus Paceibacterota bacterium]